MEREKRNKHGMKNPTFSEEEDGVNSEGNQKNQEDHKENAQQAVI